MDIPKLPLEQLLQATTPSKNPAQSSSAAPKEVPIKDDHKQVTTPPELKPLPVEVAGMKFTVTIDDIGNLTILDYPSSWHGSAKLVRFYGIASHEPLSDDHCQRIRLQAASGIGGFLVRGPYHSDLVFDTPPFLSEQFMPAIRDAAKAAGLVYHTLYATNPIDTFNAKVEVTFTDKAISHFIGRYQELYNQINLGKRGSSHPLSGQKIIVTSGDIICDLISGDATMTMVYPIKNEDRVIRVSYSALTIKLDPPGRKGM